MVQAQLEETILIERSRKGDRTAFDELVRRHQKRAYRYAYKLCHDPEEAADVVADTFVRMFKAIVMFKGEASFTTWMYRIALNCAYDARRKRLRHFAESLDAPVSTEEGPLEMQFASPEASPLQIVEKAERSECMESAMQEIPELYRRMLVLYHGETRSYEEIAEMLRVPIGTVKSRINRARRALRTRLSETDPQFLAYAI